MKKKIAFILIITIVVVSVVIYFKKDNITWDIIQKNTFTTETGDRELPSDSSKLSKKEIEFYQKTADEGDRVSQYIIDIIMEFSTIRVMRRLMNTFLYLLRRDILKHI